MVLWAFVKRDFLAETSYRFAMAEMLLSILFASTSYFFVGRLMEGGSSAELVGGSYFGFVVIGLILLPFLDASLLQVAAALRQEQMMGTLEAIAATPVNLATIMAGSALWPFCFALLQALTYLAVAVVLGVDLSRADWLSGGLVALLALGCFAWLGVLEAGLGLLIKRGNPLSWLLSLLSALVGGAFFPPSMLPNWLQWLSVLHPLSYATRGLRAALLEGTGVVGNAPEIGALLIFNLVLFPLSAYAFGRAVRVARSQGSLAHI
jgi:ABC-2 type transport system permease protein